MQPQFDLVIAANYESRTADFRLLDSGGSQLAYRQTDFNVISASKVRGLFDLRNYLRLFVEKGKEAAAVAEIGVCIAEEVLGKEIFEKLWLSKSQRTLRIELPGATETENHLASALSRVPWEIARPTLKEETLAERNLLVRVVHDMKAPSSLPVDLASGEALRVLFVFAEARGSRPLGARQERRELLWLFQKEIYPNRRVVAHFLTHGVTSERLRDQIVQNGGYHIVHWSGHGHLNLLELSKVGGDRDHLSGEELLGLFTDEGGFLPRLVFLSACHSGDILRVKDWNDFLAIAQGKEPGPRDSDAKKTEKYTGAFHTKELEDTQTRELDLQEQPGFTGTAHALLQGGVPSVVAMRYAVGDDYAREMAVEFYRALLAHVQSKDIAASLTLARQAMQDPKKHDPARFEVCDHATPVLYGTEQLGVKLEKGRSPDLNPRSPRLTPIAELTTGAHEHFVGRTWELAGLGADFIGSSSGAEVKPVAVITGLGGMGKTALVAEALALWETRFEWILLYQAKPNALAFDATLRDMHMKLMGELGRYHDHVKARPADAIYRDASAEFTGKERIERLARNLIRALKDEPILLVLDNFETNLKPHPESTDISAQPLWACQDPAWEHCLSELARELVGSSSRVLITCRRPLSAFTGGGTFPVQLGPLPASEAALYLKAHPTLGEMVFGDDPDEKKLAMRLLNASRFHPLLMDRLARLASSPDLLPQLLQALETLEKTKDFNQLPALFATKHGDAKELAYLSDALTASLDKLIAAASSDARRLLWMIAVANEPVTLGLLEGAWSGDSHEQQQLRRIRELLDQMQMLPPEMQGRLKAMSPELRAAMDALPAALTRPEIGTLLRHLIGVGLVTVELSGSGDTNPNLTCHELVRERIIAWMQQFPKDQGDLTENTIRLAYAERLKAVFSGLQNIDVATALEAGSRAIIYYVQAGVWDELGYFASTLVTSTDNPYLLEALIPHLRTASEVAPDGRPRWRCLRLLAEAMGFGGRPEASLQFYEQAAALARAAVESSEENTSEGWSDIAVTVGNWGHALSEVGDLDAARKKHLESAEASKKAGRDAIYIVSAELEAIRIDIAQGEAEDAMPEVQARLSQIEQWWRQHCEGNEVPDASDEVALARAYIAALDIAQACDKAREDWNSALSRIDSILSVKRMLNRHAEDIGVTQFNRANILLVLARFSEARAQLEECSHLFQRRPDYSAKVFSSLATLFSGQGDITQAIVQGRRALAWREQLPSPAERAGSHHNLAIYLHKLSDSPSFLAEAAEHRLAALLYRLVARLGRDLDDSFGNYLVAFRHATCGEPRVAQLLANPAFHALKEWLQQRQADMDSLQDAVDQFFAQVRQMAREESKASDAGLSPET